MPECLLRHKWHENNGHRWCERCGWSDSKHKWEVVSEVSVCAICGMVCRHRKHVYQEEPIVSDLYPGGLDPASLVGITGFRKVAYCADCRIALPDRASTKEPTIAKSYVRTPST